jgi:hypothetical protein
MFLSAYCCCVVARMGRPLIKTYAILFFLLPSHRNCNEHIIVSCNMIAQIACLILLHLPILNADDTPFHDCVFRFHQKPVEPCELVCHFDSIYQHHDSLQVSFHVANVRLFFRHPWASGSSIPTKLVRVISLIICCECCCDDRSPSSTMRQSSMRRALLTC